jgi:hypothetical protein
MVTNNLKNKNVAGALVVYAGNPNYSGSRDRDCGWKPAPSE